MKKLFSFLFTAVMLCTMSVSVFAAAVDTTGQTTSADLKVKYSEGTGRTNNYAASIAWDSMTFTYTSGSEVWNTDKMIWEESDAGAWSDAGKVTVSNKSSEAITVKFTYTADENNANGVVGIKVNNADVVEAGYTIAAATAGSAGTNGTATKREFSILPVGTYTGTNTEEIKVGTITITLE